MALIFTPFLLLVPMALISESVYLFGNNDKSYIILWSLISIAASLTVAFAAADIPAPWFLTLMTWLVFFGMAWIDTIVGGLIVKESRRDKDKGAEDMRYFQWITWSLGGIIPVLIGPFCLFQQHEFACSTLYFVLAGSSALMLIAAFFIPTDVRTIQRKEEQLGFWRYCELQIAGTKQALQIKPLRRNLQFYLLVALTTPTFQVYLGDMYNNTNDWDVLTSVVCCVTLVGTTMVY